MDAGLDRRVSLAAAALMTVPGLAAPYLSQPDNFSLYLVLGVLAMWLCVRGAAGDRRAFVLGGVAVGLAMLARTDGVLLGVPFAVAFGVERWRIWRGKGHFAPRAERSAAPSSDQGRAHDRARGADWDRAQDPARGSDQGPTQDRARGSDPRRAADRARVQTGTRGRIRRGSDGRPRWPASRCSCSSWRPGGSGTWHSSARSRRRRRAAGSSGSAPTRSSSPSARRRRRPRSSRRASARSWPAGSGGLVAAIQVIGGTPLLFFLVPFMLIGAWLHRHDAAIRPWIIYGATFLVFSALVFAVHLPYGMALHSGMSLVPRRVPADGRRHRGCSALGGGATTALGRAACHAQLHADRDRRGMDRGRRRHLEARL